MLPRQAALQDVYDLAVRCVGQLAMDHLVGIQRVCLDTQAYSPNIALPCPIYCNICAAGGLCCDVFVSVCLSVSLFVCLSV